MLRNGIPHAGRTTNNQQSIPVTANIGGKHPADLGTPCYRLHARKCRKEMPDQVAARKGPQR